MSVDRRDFLKLFAITAAGLYVPRRSYFFMPRTEMRRVQVPVWPPSLEDMQAVFTPERYREIVPCNFDSLLVQVMVDCRTQTIQSYQILNRLSSNERPHSENLRHLIGKKIHKSMPLPEDTCNGSHWALRSRSNVF